MSDYHYLKVVIEQQGLTLKQVAKQCQTTERYLSQLLQNKVPHPDAQILAALHQYLELDSIKEQPAIGVVFGKFYPLHTGHIYLIQRACSQVSQLHVVMCHDAERDLALFDSSTMSKQPRVADRLRWLAQTFKYQQNIHIHSFDEAGIPPYPNGWQVWSDRIKIFMQQRQINAQVVYSSEPQDAPLYGKWFGIETRLIDSRRSFMDISATQIRQNPFKFWEYIPTEVKPFFVRKVAILGTEQSGKSTLVNKLANQFNTTSAWEYWQEYLFTHLGGNKSALQYSDYEKIALGQAQYIDFAVKYANKVTFVDTDFVTMLAYCQQKEGIQHPFLQAMIKVYPFDQVILLENPSSPKVGKPNHPQITDGQRQLQQSLEQLLRANQIDFVKLAVNDYEQQFLQAVDIVQQMLTNKRQ